MNDWRYVAVSMLAGSITFYRYRVINRLSSPVLACDAGRLALFAVAGRARHRTSRGDAAGHADRNRRRHGCATFVMKNSSVLRTEFTQSRH